LKGAEDVVQTRNSQIEALLTRNRDLLERLARTQKLGARQVIEGLDCTVAPHEEGTDDHDAGVAGESGASLEVGPYSDRMMVAPKSLLAAPQGRNAQAIRTPEPDRPAHSPTP
jgi:hypothetical protein